MMSPNKSERSKAAKYDHAVWLLVRAADMLAQENGFDASAADALIAEISALLEVHIMDSESPYDEKGELILGDFDDDYDSQL